MSDGEISLAPGGDKAQRPRSSVVPVAWTLSTRRFQFGLARHRSKNGLLCVVQHRRLGCALGGERLLGAIGERGGEASSTARTCGEVRDRTCSGTSVRGRSGMQASMLRAVRSSASSRRTPDVGRVPRGPLAAEPRQNLGTEPPNGRPSPRRRGHWPFSMGRSRYRCPRWPTQQASAVRRCTNTSPTCSRCSSPTTASMSRCNVAEPEAVVSGHGLPSERLERLVGACAEICHPELGKAMRTWIAWCTPTRSWTRQRRSLSTCSRERYVRLAAAGGTS